jgi:WD40 repeat protein
MLACGTSAGEVMLYDITNPHEPRDVLASPDAAPSGTAVPYAPQFRSGPGEVLSLQFNNVSTHIIAIGFANGATHLYDSRNRRKVLEFVDENLPRRIAGVAWAPSDETHLVLASEDDRSPTLQFWDLRKVSFIRCHNHPPPNELNTPVSYQYIIIAVSIPRIQSIESWCCCLLHVGCCSLNQILCRLERQH